MSKHNTDEFKQKTVELRLNVKQTKKIVSKYKITKSACITNYVVSVKSRANFIFL